MTGFTISSYPSGLGWFNATGSLDGCVTICKNWNASFTQSPGPYTWQTKYLDVTVNHSTGEGYYTCVVSYSRPNGPATCFPNGDPLEEGVPGDAEFVGWETGRVCL